MYPALLDLALLFGACIAVAVAFHRLRLPPVVGFLVTGALVGPHSFGLVGHPELVEELAEIGVVVLLFTVGLEISLAQLVRLRRTILVGGFAQVLGTVTLGTLVSWASGLGFGTSVFLGYLLSLSSTAAISKLLIDRGEFSAPTGRLAIGVCIAQDLAVLPMILTVPLLVGTEGTGGAELLKMVEGVGLLLLTAMAAVFLFPRILDLVARTRSRELFVLTVITLCLAVAIATAKLGLSLAIGAFLAGVVLGSSEYRHQAAAEIEPFRDALSSLFFVSIGMLFDWRVILAEPATVAVALAAVVFGKAGVVLLAARLLRTARWVAIRSALLLAQVGEFSFVLLQVASGEGLLPDRLRDIFIVVAVATIATTPLMAAVGRRITRSHEPGAGAEDAGQERLRDHAVLVGFGPAGQALARSLRQLGIDYQVVEMNPETVKQRRAEGEPIQLGDASREAVLHSVSIERARLLVVAVGDPQATRRVVAAARRLAPHLHVLTRAQFLSEVPQLLGEGASEVVPQELETAVEIAARALRYFLVPDDEVGKCVKEIREDAFGISKVAPKANGAPRISEFVPGLGVQIYQVETGAELVGVTLRDANLRRRAGLNVVCLKRGNRTFLDLDPDTALEVGDILVAVGSENRMQDASAVFRRAEAD